MSQIIEPVKFVQGYEFYWFVGISALLFLFAGIKLQFRISEIENIYYYLVLLDNNKKMN